MNGADEFRKFGDEEKKMPLTLLHRLILRGNNIPYYISVLARSWHSVQNPVG